MSNDNVIHLIQPGIFDDQLTGLRNGAPAQFERAGCSIPASPETVAEYLAQNASKLGVSTLVRRV